MTLKKEIDFTCEIFVPHVKNEMDLTYNNMDFELIF